MSQGRRNYSAYAQDNIDQPNVNSSRYYNGYSQSNSYAPYNSYNTYNRNTTRNCTDYQRNQGPSTSTVVLNSTLTPLAQEFVPAAQYERKQGQGAVKRTNFWNSRNGKNYRSQDYRNREEQSKYERKPHDRDLQENRREDNYYRNYKSPKSGDGYFKNRSNGYFKNTYRNHYRKPEKSQSHQEEKPTKTEAEKNFTKKLDAASQRERLEQMIVRRLLECLVCCEKLRHSDKIWSCKQCFHIMHLECIKQWAQSSKLESGWRCPACQNVYEKIPEDYYCYCGKNKEPNQEPGGLPHSCGEPCSRKSRCEHTCSIICHPGPCPECNSMVPRSCGCTKTIPIVKCSSSLPITCDSLCGKQLNCLLHNCQGKCHVGECEPCSELINQKCFCGKESREVSCEPGIQEIVEYSCEKPCERELDCGNHKCERNCHSGECSPCERSPKLITTCPCGKTTLINERKSCLDPIPLCDQKCKKRLNCGQPSAPHHCSANCHEGACPPCGLSTLVRCRCGHMDKELPCAELTTKADDARCEKKCSKKRLCAKHKCNQRCCIEIDHVCPLICNRNLTCGLHRCEETCHKGRCPPCWRSSFDELYCECGASVLYPPVACGTRPPPCDRICSRIPECGHEVFHTCHTGPCPPCTVLTKRLCHGGHEQRSTILCHQVDFSCGLACGKPMSCGRHKCAQACHLGECKSPCTQPCTNPKPLCGHPCGQPCHEGVCPESLCKQIVKVTCECGNRTNSRICLELNSEYQNIAMAQLAAKIEKMQTGQTVDVSDISTGVKKPSTLKILECNDECRVLERNRRLAIGLQIRNPDINAKLTPRYTDYMRTWTKKDPKFCQYVHDKLTELVQLANKSKQKSRSFSFESMNREKRHFVHEYCEHFGCESAAYDPEPNRNVVATAIRDKSWLPSYSLLEVIQRENGQRKVPGPQQLGKGMASKGEAVALKPSWRLNRPQTPPNEYVDSFDP